MLFHDIIFGPIRSRRLGLSLGVNLLPAHGKWCSFDCIYCECGWNADGKEDRQLPSREVVATALKQKLSELAGLQQLPDVITFSGNGEPSLHPDFETIMQDTCALRDRYAPQAQICVLSNASQLHRPEVRRALFLADKRIMKIDSALADTVALIDQPVSGYHLDDVIAQLQAFKGDFTLQTMFLRGQYQGRSIDNTVEAEVAAWLELVQKLTPKEIMIYTLDREAPAKGLEKVGLAPLEAIATRARALGFSVQVSG
jgi:Fe-S oxidoreductases